MQGMSERRYAAHVGLSRGAIQKAKAAGRLVLFPDGSIDPARSDALRVGATDPSKTRRPEPPPAASAREAVPAPPASGGTTFLQARTSHEVLKAQERRLRLDRLKGELVERDKAKALVFRLARQERDAWVTWPARVAALMAAEIGTDAATMQRVLETHVRAHLDALADLRIEL